MRDQMNEPKQKTGMENKRLAYKDELLEAE